MVLLMKFLKRLFYSLSALILVYFVYFMSISLLKVGLKEASKNFFFISLSLYLVLPLIKIIRDKRNIPKDAVITNRINKTLKELKDDTITKLQGVTIKYKKNKEYVDSFVVTEDGVFNIVLCNYRGDIIIKKGDGWFNDRIKESVELISPIEKIKRNRKILSNSLQEDEIIDIIVMTDSFVTVYEEEASSVPIVRFDDLVDYIKEYEGEEKYDAEELYDKLYPLIYKEKDLAKETELLEKYLDNRWQYRSRVAMISFFALFYMFKILKIT